MPDDPSLDLCANCGHIRYFHRPSCEHVTSWRYDTRCPCDEFVERDDDADDA